ncbi:MAG: sensor histidine kinase [Burkholderiaceae bacterium]
MRFRGLLLWVLAWLGLWCGAGAAPLELTQARAAVTVGGVTERADVTLPYHWDRVHHTQPGEALFEVPFSLPDQPSEPYGVYFPRIGNRAEIWLNGTLLSRLGEVDRPNTADYAKGPQYVSIAPRLLQRDNLLRIHIRADGGRRGGLSTLTVGPADEVHDLYGLAWRWRVLVSLAITIFSLLVAAIALALWATQSEPGRSGATSRDNIYLCAALAELCWALRVGDVAIEHPPLPWPWWGVVLTASFAGWIGCIALFCHHVAGWHRHRSMPWVRTGLWGLFGASIVASSLSFTLYEPLFLTAWLGCANLFFIVYATVYLVGAIRRPGTAHGLVALVGALNVLVGVRDWLTIRINGGYADSTWMRYSSVLFGITLGYIVITRFREASIQARGLLATLASRVSQKELELQQSYARVEQLAREQERTAERARILRDMHDGVGSHISAAIRQLQSGRASSEAVLQTLRDSLDQLKLSIDAMNLLPGDITALLANLRYRLEPRFAASDIELQWGVELLEPVQRLDANAMRQLQFMVFEALSNVLQHARASVLRIEASPQGAGVQLRIIDNGRGFDVAAPRRKGLLSMQERAAAIGAGLAMDSEPGRTVVEIRLA